MDPILIIIIEVGVAILVVAMLIQLAFWLALARLGLRMRTQVKQSIPRLRALQSLSKEVLQENREPALEMAASVKKITNVARHEAVLLKDTGGEALRFYRTERQHAGVVADDARHRAQETTHLVRRGIQAPFRGVASGVRSAIRHWTKHAA